MGLLLRKTNTSQSPQATCWGCCSASRSHKEPLGPHYGIAAHDYLPLAPTQFSCARLSFVPFFGTHQPFASCFLLMALDDRASRPSLALGSPHTSILVNAGLFSVPKSCMIFLAHVGILSQAENQRFRCHYCQTFTSIRISEMMVTIEQPRARATPCTKLCLLHKPHHRCCKHPWPERVLQNAADIRQLCRLRQVPLHDQSVSSPQTLRIRVSGEAVSD